MAPLLLPSPIRLAGRLWRAWLRAKFLAYDHVSHLRHLFCATFIAEGEKTRVSVRMLFLSAESREKTAKVFGAVEGLGQTLGRMADYVHLAARSGG